MVIKVFPLNFQWPTQDPFLFCVHHLDRYPMGNPDQSIDEKYLKGRSLGSDFEEQDGFRMYHGEKVPGFPVHPHRGFETITIVRQGFIDHADSLGAAGRYSAGDVQWMTAGSGVQHSEMFPLVHQTKDNTVELFQIWLNLPKSQKMTQPEFKMFWNEDIPVCHVSDDVEIRLICGEFSGLKSPNPPQASWASKDENEVQIWTVKIKQGAEFELPITKQNTFRTIYFFSGNSLLLNDSEEIPSMHGFQLDSQLPCQIKANQSDCEFLMLQSKPISEPVVQYGPFVMNTKEEIMKAFQEYQLNQFGGWPWPRTDMIHGSELRRFARFPDGHQENPKDTK